MLVWSTAPARADGDPASDVLATGPLFLPADAGIPVAEQLQLEALVQSAGRSGFPIRAALISSPADLGSITALWRAPRQYASFLGEELSLTYRGLLLVIMPDGFGVYDQGQPTRSYVSALAGTAIHPTGAGLAGTAITAIRQLASLKGHPLTLPQVQAKTALSHPHETPWIVVGLGLAAIGLAWSASLRARPLGSRSSSAPAG